MYAGAVLLLDHPWGAPTKHFCIALCDGYGDPPTAIIVPLNSKDSSSDLTVVLQPGDHEVIRHETCVTYILAETRAVVAIERNITKAYADLAPDVLQKVLTGATTSKRTKHRIKRVLAELAEKSAKTAPSAAPQADAGPNPKPPTL